MSATSGWLVVLVSAVLPIAASAEEPTWAAVLFPNTDAPAQCQPRFRRIAAEEVPVGDRKGGQVTVELLHRDAYGETQTAQARIFIPPALLDDPARRVPLVHAAGYEIDAGGASGYLARGFAVSTPHAHPQNPLSRGPNLDTAILHGARALPFVDDSTVLIQGGSAGGYTTLMLAAETFPLTAAMPDVPPTNWGYNAAYFIRNRERAKHVLAGETQSVLPVLNVVIGLADEGVKMLGPDTGSDAWLHMSPISHLDTITCPTQVTFSTADMLVPIDQMSRAFVRPFDSARFPEGFTMRLNDCVAPATARKTLLDVLDRDRYELFVVAVPNGAVELRPGVSPTQPAAHVPLPFSEKRTFSLVVIDEGAPEPWVGHLKYHLNADRTAFREWAQGQPIAPDQLTQAKLERLMMRYAGEPYLAILATPEGKPGPMTLTTLDFPEAERADVLRSLRTYAMDPACAERLVSLYRKLPKRLQLLGQRVGSVEAMREAIRETR